MSRPIVLICCRTSLGCAAPLSTSADVFVRRLTTSITPGTRSGNVGGLTGGMLLWSRGELNNSYCSYFNAVR